MEINLALEPALTSIVRPAVLRWIGAHVVEREPRLDAMFAAAEAGLRAAPPADTAAVRTMYKRLGLDPTKTRPSNEALLRRVLKGQPLPRVNSRVDAIYGFENFEDNRYAGYAVKPVMMFCGNDAGAKTTVSSLIKALGWQPLDVGGVEQASLHSRRPTPLGVSNER